MFCFDTTAGEFQLIYLKSYNDLQLYIQQLQSFEPITTIIKIVILPHKDVLYFRYNDHCQLEYLDEKIGVLNDSFHYAAHGTIIREWTLLSKLNLAKLWI